MGNAGNMYRIYNNMSYMKLLKPTITHIQANIAFFKTGKYLYELIKSKSEHIESK
jgi:hypothetical protein